MSKLKKALEKAEEVRSENKDDIFLDESVTPAPSSALSVRHFDKTPLPVTHEYVQTKVQHVDFQFLRHHKIIPICSDNHVADKIKILRTQILDDMMGHGKNSLLITSANRREGRTVTAINLAISIAHQIDCTMLLVDADLRNPSIHKLFGIEAQKGLSDYLLGKADIPDILINPGIPRLVILPGGKPLSNSAEHFDAPRMQLLIREMKARYPDRFIIFDSSPLLTSADPLILSRYIDEILLVIEAEKTTKNDIKHVMELLKNKSIIGTVFNKLKH